MEPQDLAAVIHPAAPWRLGGEGWVAALPVDRPLAVPDGLRVLAPRRLMVVLNRYTHGTLSYDELLFGAAVLQGARPALWISHAWVDSLKSVAAGRRIWSIPKLPARFVWQGDAVDVEDEDGPVAGLCVQGSTGFAPKLPLWTPAIGRRLDERFAGTGSARATRSRLEVLRWPLRFDFAPIGPGEGVHLRELSLTFRAPKQVAAGWLMSAYQSRAHVKLTAYGRHRSAPASATARERTWTAPGRV